MEKIRIVRVASRKNMASYQDRLIKIYQRAFEEPPWYEHFSEKEVFEWFGEMMACSGKIVLVMYFRSELVGASFCVNADLKHDVWQYLPPTIAKQDVIYLAESFIDPRHQRKGLGKILHDQRLELARQAGYRFALQRTSAYSGMFALIKRTGFVEIGRQIVVSAKKINGLVKEVPDERVISLKQF